MSKFYAVKIGKATGVFTSWDECEKQVKGFPNASYKAFKIEAEALDYLGGMNTSQSSFSPVDVQLFTDGSFNQSKQQYGWGFVAVKDGHTRYKKFGTGTNPNYLGSRQIGGELVAVLQALDYAIYKGYEHAEICYDYAGVEKWATGDWETNAPVASAYVYWLNEKKKQITVSFRKVTAHSGNHFNNMADVQAKKGANA